MHDPFLVAVTEKVSDAQVSISSAVAANLLSFLEHPLKSLSQPSFLLIMTVYCSTYVVVNLISSFSELHQLSAGWLKLIGATVTNTSLGMMKDRYFASVFGRQGAAVSFPLASVLLLLARDVLTVTAAFNLPGTVTNYVRTRGLVTAKRRAEILAQFFVPMLSQFVVTPLHLVALDIYYRPGLHFFDRLFHLESILVPALLTRMARVLCAYGIAGSVNTICKEALNRHFFPPKIPSGGNI